MEQNRDAIREAMRMANSPAGQQLFRILQSGGGQELNIAMAKASAGDYDGAKQLLSRILTNPEAQALLRQMGGSHGPDGR